MNSHRFIEEENERLKAENAYLKKAYHEAHHNFITYVTSVSAPTDYFELKERIRVLEEALSRIVNDAFEVPSTRRHKRSGFAGSPCDSTCQPCALNKAREALTPQPKDNHE